MAILDVNNIRKVYITRFGGNRVEALRDINFSVEEGEYVAIMGESGSGKSTLLNILAALDQPTSGEVLLDGKPMGDIPEKELAGFRRENLGFVFQDFNLLDTFSIRDNIYLPLVLSGHVGPTEMALRIKPLAQRLGIEQLLAKYPYEVSGGEKQRAYLAQALCSDPELLILDEATASLDTESKNFLLQMLKSIMRDKNLTVLFITHDPELIEKYGDYELKLQNHTANLSQKEAAN